MAKNAANRHHRRRVWCERWIIEGETVRQLAAQSGYSPRTLHRGLASWLAQPPPRSGECATARQLIVDGTRIERRNGGVAGRDAARAAVVYAAPEMTEGPAPLPPVGTQLAAHGCAPIRAPIDGNPHLIRILRRLWPTLVSQRCLVHIQRHGLSWCRRHPKRREASHLRTLFRQVMAIPTVADREHFIAQVQAWERR